MDKFIERRISISSCWASSRFSLLDSIENYEDSYAITQEFREWIVCLEGKTSHIESTVLKVPNSINEFKVRARETDELLEL